MNNLTRWECSITSAVPQTAVLVFFVFVFVLSFHLVKHVFHAGVSQRLYFVEVVGWFLLDPGMLSWSGRKRASNGSNVQPSPPFVHIYHPNQVWVYQLMSPASVLTVISFCHHGFISLKVRHVHRWSPGGAPALILRPPTWQVSFLQNWAAVSQKSEIKSYDSVRITILQQKLMLFFGCFFF